MSPIHPRDRWKVAARGRHRPVENPTMLLVRTLIIAITVIAAVFIVTILLVAHFT